MRLGLGRHGPQDHQWELRSGICPRQCLNSPPSGSFSRITPATPTIAKSTDTAEYPKHFLDLESYPDYPHLTPRLAALVTQYGWTTVRANGILPWAALWAFDSLTAQFRRRDLVRAYQTAADLGHYIGDAHNPLHCTVNYDGQLTGNNGIHSRYETGMINLVQGSIAVPADTVRFIPDPYTFIFNGILRSRELVDSILLADNAARSASGWNGSTACTPGPITRFSGNGRSGSPPPFCGSRPRTLHLSGILHG